jgi:hypothetical protein
MEKIGYVAWAKFEMHTKILFGETEGKISFGKRKRRQDDNIKMEPLIK